METALLARQLLTDANEIEACGGGNEAATMRKAADRLQSLLSERDKLRDDCSRANSEICQTLGKALGYPWFKDDPKNFPGATEENGVCVGDHVAESIAEEAAKRITELSAALTQTEVP